MSNPTAPVCLIEPVISTQQPAPTRFPSIPQATNLASAIAAINALTSIVRTLTNQFAIPGAQGIQGQAGQAGAPGAAAPKGGRFQEVTNQRVVNQITVASSQDPSTSLTFSRIDGLSFVDSKTGEPWIWQRGSG